MAQNKGLLKHAKIKGKKNIKKMFYHITTYLEDLDLKITSLRAMCIKYLKGFYHERNQVLGELLLKYYWLQEQYTMLSYSPKNTTFILLKLQLTMRTDSKEG
jgi:hypothetical protein